MIAATHGFVNTDRIAIKIHNKSTVALNMFVPFSLNISPVVACFSPVVHLNNVLHFKADPPAVRADRISVVCCHADHNGSLFNISALGAFVEHFSSFPPRFSYFTIFVFLPQYGQIGCFLSFPLVMDR